MRPPEFRPLPFEGDERFVRDQATGLVWHRVSTRPLYADTDRSQVVYHANYLRYFELGRVTLMRDTGYSYREVEDQGFVYPIIDLAIRFHLPIFYDDLIWVHTRPSELDRIRVGFQYLVTRDDGSPACSGHTRHCALNARRIPTPVDPLTVTMWKRFPT